MSLGGVQKGKSKCRDILQSRVNNLYTLLTLATMARIHLLKTHN